MEELKTKSVWTLFVVATLIVGGSTSHAQSSDTPSSASPASASPSGDSLTFTPEERLSGFAIRDGETWFVFDPAAYGASTPQRVVVTGAFRTWSQDMDDLRWQLKQPSGSDLWLLSINNPNYSSIPPSTPFKFRIDAGEWLQPPHLASNREGGNLVFAPGVAPLRMRAEIRTDRTLWVQLTGEGVERSLNPQDYRLLTDEGLEIPISQVLPNTAAESLLALEQSIDPRRVYYLEYDRHKLRSLCKRDGWYRTMYSHQLLGANVAPDGSHTSFRVFAPRAERVVLYLYLEADDSPENAWMTIEMADIDHGVWETVVDGDLHGIYYDLTVHGPSDRGNRFYESHPVHITDPYARVSLDSFGKARVWRPTQPARPLPQGRPAFKDVVAYEVHVQDFTADLPVDARERGTFAAMARSGLQNASGHKIGFDHLLDLGINVVHLMPVQEYLHYPDNEWQAAFRDNPFMMEQGIHLENYDWGYRTTHAFALESRYRVQGTEPGEERTQFRDMVDAFHEKGIAVIVDIVPNHTGENMDGRNYLFNFGAIDTDYYYRTSNELEHIGPYGNEVKFEDRPMSQRWLIDQCLSLMNEFGIDGFRVDLAGQIDKQTLIKLRQSLPPDTILYGEPWIPPSDPDVAKSTDWGWYKKDAPIPFFQDDARNAFKGPVSDPIDKKTSRGFAGGDSSLREAAMRGLANHFDEEATPIDGINYLDIHDNWTLADQFASKDWDGRYGVDDGPYRIAAGLLMTSLGPIVLHGGSEFLRTKGLAGNQEQTFHTSSGPLAFHGQRDTTNVRTPNLFVWENVGNNLVLPTGNLPYAKMHAFWKGLIAMRMSPDGAVFRIDHKPPENYYRWLLPSDPHLLGYIVADRYLVLINTSTQTQDFREVSLAPGEWNLICDGETVDHVHGIAGADSKLTGIKPINLTVPAHCIKIWHRKQD
jgi:pullulanase/glycogen debranching enzyme